MSKEKKEKVRRVPHNASSIENASQSYTKYYSWIIFAFSFLLYSNTLTHEYTQDDAIVIYDNMFTQEGFSGIPGLLKYDTFYGFFKTEGKAKLVSGGRYRPLTPIMFAIEYQIFGDNPFWSHLINVILYGLLCVLIYKTLILLFSHSMRESSGFYLFAFLATLLYAAHPLHTEAVANIKGRDEIMSMMGAILSLFFTLKYIDQQNKKYIIGAFLSMFLGLMSKENAITFLAVIPLSIFFFRTDSIKKSMLPFLAVGLGSILFLIIRFSVLGMDFGGTPKELMNNPYLKIEGNQYVPFLLTEKIATIIYTLGKYIGLLLFPHPLTHDYYPRHIEIMNFGNWKVILSIITYIGLLFIVIKQWKKKSIIAFSILYFLITLSIVSNIVFPIGTNMSERFMFMPSLGFALLISHLIYKQTNKKGHRIFIMSMAFIVLLLSGKTFTRNFDWKNDFTLFTTDVKTSPNSAKVLNAAGGALVAESSKPKNASKKDKMLNQAIPYLKKALEIHPNYKNAALLLGNAYFYTSDFENAIKAYDRTLTISPGYPEGEKNLAIALREAGRMAGEKENNLEKAKKYLSRSIQLIDTDPDAYRLLGITYGMAGDHREAIKYFTKVTEITPNNAGAYVNLAKAYQYYGDEDNSRINYQKALEIDPNAMNER